MRNLLKVSWTLCIVLAALCCATAAGAADAPDLRAQAEAGLKTLAAAEFALYSIRGHYGAQSEMEEARDGRIGDGVTGLLQAKPDTGVYYSVAASKDGHRFFAVAYYGREFTTLYIDETGVISNAAKVTSAQQLIEQQQLSAFFTAKPQWADEAETILKLQMHQVQLAVERWSVDRSTGGQDLYPLTLDAIVSDGYIPAGFYPNPITAWGVDEYNAQVVPLGQWSPGDFSYVPQVKDGVCTGYMLAGYACRRTAGYDYNNDGAGDGYAIVLSSGTNEPDWYRQTLAQVK